MRTVRAIDGAKIKGTRTDSPCGGSCRWAMYDTCRCECGGKYHGIMTRDFLKRYRVWWAVLPLEQIKTEMKIPTSELITDTYWMLKGHATVGYVPATLRQADEQEAAIVEDALGRGWIVARWYYHTGNGVIASAPMNKCIPISKEMFDTLYEEFTGMDAVRAAYIP